MSCITQTFYGRTFMQTVEAVAAWLKASGLEEITSQWSETTAGWSAVVYARRRALSATRPWLNAEHS